MNVKQYRTSEQDSELLQGLRMRTMRRYDLTLEQVVRNGLDEPQMEEHARATLAADIKRNASWDKDAMGRFRAVIAKRYGIPVSQVVQNGLDKPLMEEDARATLAAEVLRVQAHRNRPREKKLTHCSQIVPSVRTALHVLSA